MTDNEKLLTINDLPISFTVKYIGFHPANGLWGMKHTRKPVDTLVTQAKSLPPGKILPIVKLEVAAGGLSFFEVSDKKSSTEVHKFAVDVISYGVQDLVYTRVFSIIIVTDEDPRQGIPFICHSFVCESRNQARQITYALAAAFQEYGKTFKQTHKNSKKRFTIDLRTPEEQAAASDEETEA